MFDEAYSQIRIFLNNENPPSAAEILNQWPVVFKKRAIVYHFIKLTNNNLENFSLNLTQKTKKIQLFNAKIKLVTEDNFTSITALKCITAYFDENFNDFFVYVNAS